MEWYYAIGEEQKGPVDEETLRRLAASRQLSPHDLIWNPSLGDQWVRADRLPGLFGPIRTPGVPPPPAAENRLGGPPPVEPAPMPDNSELTRRARAHLDGFWGLAIGATLLNLLIDQGLSNLIPLLGPIVSLLISGALSLGLTFLFLNRIRGRSVGIEQLFSGFQLWGTALGVYLLSALIVLLGFLLLIVPGVILSLGLSFCFHVLADEPDLGVTDVLGRSWDLARGHKWQMFRLGFRFLGWALLCVLTLGIGFIWLAPYMTMTHAGFYEAARAERSCA